MKKKKNIFFEIIIFKNKLIELDHQHEIKKYWLGL